MALLLLPGVESPSVMILLSAPKGLVFKLVPIAVPDLIVNPPVNELAPDKVSVVVPILTRLPAVPPSAMMLEIVISPVLPSVSAPLAVIPPVLIVKVPVVLSISPPPAFTMNPLVNAMVPWVEDKVPALVASPRTMAEAALPSELLFELTTILFALIVPWLMVVVPVYVLAPVKLRVPAPDLIMLYAPLITPLMASVPELTFIVLSAPNIIGADIVPAPKMDFDDPDRVTAVAPDIAPLTVRSPVTIIPLVLVARVMFDDDSVKSMTDTPAELIVTVPVPEFESKTTLLTAIGR